MRYILALPLTLALSGCLFFWVPLKSSEGNTCVAANATIGQSIRQEGTGKVGPITKLYGRSDRCSVEAQPILADVDYH